MSYKNAQHYRHTVHRYLDAIWVLGSKKGKARSSMYRWLANKMNIPEEETHVKYFTRAQCREAIKILRPMYKQLYGKDLDYKKEIKNASLENEVKLENMYYSNKTTKVYVTYNKSSNKRVNSCWYITIYCKTKCLSDDKVYDFSKIDTKLIQKLGAEDLDKVFDFKITLENIAYWIWEQIIPCYKVEIKTENSELVIYEEDKN